MKKEKERELFIKGWLNMPLTKKEQKKLNKIIERISGNHEKEIGN